MIHTLHLTLPKVFLIRGDQSLLVDSGGPKDVPRILEFLRRQRVDNLSLILLTHGHWDHAGGAAALREATGAAVAIHHADAERMRRGANGLLKPTSVMGSVLRPFLDRPYPPCAPDIELDEEIDLADFGVAGRVLFTPGHTPGSLSVRTDDGEVIVGDLIMGGWWGGRLFPAWPGLHYFAEDVTQVYASIRKLLATEPICVHCGHGGPINAQRLERWVAANDTSHSGTQPPASCSLGGV